MLVNPTRAGFGFYQIPGRVPGRVHFLDANYFFPGELAPALQMVGAGHRIPGRAPKKTYCHRHKDGG